MIKPKNTGQVLVKMSQYIKIYFKNWMLAIKAIRLQFKHIYPMEDISCVQQPQSHNSGHYCCSMKQLESIFAPIAWWSFELLPEIAYQPLCEMCVAVMSLWLFHQRWTHSPALSSPLQTSGRCQEDSAPESGSSSPPTGSAQTHNEPVSISRNTLKKKATSTPSLARFTYRCIV